MGDGDIRVATTSRELLIRFRFVNAPGFGDGIDLFLRGFGIISGVVRGSWGGAGMF